MTVPRLYLSVNGCLFPDSEPDPAWGDVAQASILINRGPTRPGVAGSARTGESSGLWKCQRNEEDQGMPAPYTHSGLLRSRHHG